MMAEIPWLLGSGAVGAALGYMGKAAIDHFLAIRRARLERIEKREQLQIDRSEEQFRYEADHFHIPCRRCLDRFLSRIQIFLSGAYKILTYDDEYVQKTVLFECACLCYWLDAPERDPRVVSALREDHEKLARAALTALLRIPMYEQKRIGAMMQRSSGRFGPVSFPEFDAMVTVAFPLLPTDESCDVYDAWEDLFYSREINEKKEVVTKAIDDLLYLSLKLQQSSEAYEDVRCG